MLRRTGPVIAAVAFVMFPTLALAQVNIDQGKSAADIFSSVCTACHKSSRGLAAGKNSLMLSAFLREHYTASSDQASALAAYVLGAGGSEPAPKQKPDVEHARADEPKAGEPKAAEPKTAEPKTPSHPVRAASKPDEEKRPKQEAKREEHVASPPGPEKPEAAPETASREATPKPDDAAHEACACLGRAHASTRRKCEPECCRAAEFRAKIRSLAARKCCGSGRAAAQRRCRGAAR